MTKRWDVEIVRRGPHGIPTTVTQPEDPAQVLLQDPNVFSTPNPDIFRDTCYICLDPEFAAMGLPLCYPCSACGGHVAADDTICDDCGKDAQELFQEQAEAECAAEGHVWVSTVPYEVLGIKIGPTPHCDRCHTPWLE